MAALSLPDAKTHLNITVTTHDGELTGIIAAAEAAIAQRVGPLESTAVTARLSGRSQLVLPVYPVISLTTVVDAAGSPLTVGGLTVDTATGVLSYVAGGTFASSYYTVTYQAGRTAVPADLMLAVKELVRHLWESQRGPARFPALDDPAMPTGAGFLFPYRVQELLAPHMQYGFA